MNASERIAAQIHAANGDLTRAQVLDSIGGAIAAAHAAGKTDRAIGRRLEEWLDGFASRDDLDSAATAVADLRFSLLVPDAHRPLGIGGVISSISRWLFDHYAAVAGLSIAAAGALYGLSYSLFYASLGTSPGRVGLTVSQIVGSSASGGLLLTAVLAIFLFIGFLPLALLEDEPEPTSTSWTRALVYLGLLVPSMAGIWALSKAFDNPSTTTGMLIGGVLAWVAIGFFGAGIPSKKRLRIPPLAFKRESFGALAIAVLPLALLVASFTTVNECIRLGREAQDGWPVSDPRLLGVPFIGVRAELVTVRWTGRSPGRRLPRCLLYLGNSDGQAVVYSARMEATIRLPVDAVELGVGYSPAGCFP